MLVVVFLLLRTFGSDNDKSVSTGKSGASAGGRAGSGSDGAGSDAGGGSSSAGDVDAGGSSSASANKPLPGGGGATSIPLNVAVKSPTTGLHDGDAVSIHVTPKKGSVIYGFEAFLCKGGDTKYVLDADIRPNQAGKCVAKPVSAASQDYVEVRAQPPYQVADAAFRVGVGSNTVQTRDGRTVTITCGPKNPCAVVLKLQFPNGYGFQAIPVTFR